MEIGSKSQRAQPIAALVTSVLLLVVVQSLRRCQAELQPQPFGQRRRNAEIALHMSTRGDEDAFQWRNDGRQARLVSCRNDANVCRDPLRNPGGGSTCCWNRICKDTENDNNHCGKCGQRCGIGLHCCGGSCVNYLWDNYNCGCCGHRCVPPWQCAFGMCGYAGTSSE